MIEKRLGKIDFVEYGFIKDRPFLMGIQFGFSMNDSGIMDGGKYTINISKECRWSEEERKDAITKSVDQIEQILKDAKVNYVSELLGKPVEITIKDNWFQDFRILTEVL